MSSAFCSSSSSSPVGPPGGASSSDLAAIARVLDTGALEKGEGETAPAISEGAVSDSSTLLDEEGKEGVTGGAEPPEPPAIALLPFQLAAVSRTIDAFSREDVRITRFFNGGCTGSGKTYMSGGVLRILEKRAFVVCPKQVVPPWFKVLRELGCDILGVSNYDSIRNCKYYANDFRGKTQDCSYIRKIIVPLTPLDIAEGKTKPNFHFEWSLPDDCILIFDEFHVCRNPGTVNAKLLNAVTDDKSFKNQVLGLSATITDKVKTFAVFYKFFSGCESTRDFRPWLNAQVKEKAKKPETKGWTKNQFELSVIHDYVFGGRGVRITQRDIARYLPPSRMTCLTIEMKESYELDLLCVEFAEAVASLKKAAEGSSGLGRITKICQQIEMLSVPMYVQHVKQLLFDPANNSVVIFTNYRDTMWELQAQIEYETDVKVDSFVCGGQTMAERVDCVDKFQTGVSRVCIANYQSGGTGLGLHWVHKIKGGGPRRPLYMMNWSGIAIKQALGRTERVSGLGDVEHTFLFGKGTMQDRMREVLQNKLTALSGLMEGDLSVFEMKVEDLEYFKKASGADGDDEDDVGVAPGAPALGGEQKETGGPGGAEGAEGAEESESDAPTRGQGPSQQGHQAGGHLRARTKRRATAATVWTKVGMVKKTRRLPPGPFDAPPLDADEEEDEEKE